MVLTTHCAGGKGGGDLAAIFTAASLSAGVVYLCHTFRTNSARRCTMAQEPLLRRWRKRRSKTSWPIFPNRSADTSCPPSRWTGRGFRCPSHTWHNGIRRAAWRNFNVRALPAQLAFANAASGTPPQSAHVPVGVVNCASHRGQKAWQDSSAGRGGLQSSAGAILFSANQASAVSI